MGIEELDERAHEMADEARRGYPVLGINGVVMGYTNDPDHGRRSPRRVLLRPLMGQRRRRRSGALADAFVRGMVA